jgi:hypothetical protein
VGVDFGSSLNKQTRFALLRLVWIVMFVFLHVYLADWPCNVVCACIAWDLCKNTMEYVRSCGTWASFRHSSFGHWIQMRWKSEPEELLHWGTRIVWFCFSLCWPFKVPGNMGSVKISCDTMDAFIFCQMRCFFQTRVPPAYVLSTGLLGNGRVEW